MKPWQIVILIYLGVMSLVGFISMFSDKRKAKLKRWRTPEAVLFLIALIGGSPGSFLGMWVFRHKTKHWYFVIGMPLILAAHIALVLYLMTL